MDLRLGVCRKAEAEISADQVALNPKLAALTGL